MTKIYNGDLVNTEVVFSFGTVQFDADGIADITPDENADLILGVGAFRIADESLLKSIEDAKNKATEPIVPSTEADKEKAGSLEPHMPETLKKAVAEAEAKRKAKVEALSDKQKGDAIDAVAKEIGFEYPEEVTTKAEKVEAIQEFYANKE